MKFTVLLFLVAAFALGQSLPSDNGRIQASRLFAEGRFVEVKQLTQARLGDDRASAPWWIMAAEAMLELEEFESACTHFAKAHALNPSLDSMMVRYGLALVRTGRTTEALDWLKPFATVKDKERRATAIYYMALARLADDEPVKGRVLLIEALELAPSQARILVRLCQIDLVEGRLDDALRYAEAALSLKPLSVAAAHVKALALARQNRMIESKAAVEHHRRLLDANDRMATLVASLPTHRDPVQVCISLSEIASSVSDHELAMTWANRALQRDPTSTAAEANLRIRRAETRPSSRKST